MLLCFVWGWEVCKSVGREPPFSCPYILTREIQLEWKCWTLVCILMDPPEERQRIHTSGQRHKASVAWPFLSCFSEPSFFKLHFYKKPDPSEQRKTRMTALAFHSVENCNSVKVSLRNSAEAQTLKLHLQSPLSATKLILCSQFFWLLHFLLSWFQTQKGKYLSSVIYQCLRHSQVADSLLHCPLGFLHASLYLLNSAALPARFPLWNTFQLFLMLGNCVQPHGLSSSTDHCGASWIWLCGTFHSTLRCSFLRIDFLCPAKLYPHTTMLSAPSSSPSSHNWASSSEMTGTQTNLAGPRPPVAWFVERKYIWNVLLISWRLYSGELPWWLRW